MVGQADSEKSKNVTAWVAIAISVVGLVATNVWSLTQFDNQGTQISTQEEALSAQKEALAAQKEALAAQKEALSQAKEQFEQAHGVLTVTSRVAARDSTGAWTTDIQSNGLYSGETLDADFFESHRTYVFIKVVNTGTGATEVTHAGVVLDNSGKVYSSDEHLQCPSTETEELLECKFPLRVEPQATKYIYVQMSSSQTDAMTCNDYVTEHGLVGGIRDATGELLSSETGTLVAWSAYCPTSAATPTATAAPTAAPAPTD